MMFLYLAHNSPNSVIIDFGNESVAKATEPENLGWVDTKVHDKTLHATVKADSIGSLREAAEDFMSCLSVAKNVAKQ